MSLFLSFPFYKHIFAFPTLKQSQKLFFESLTLSINTPIFTPFTTSHLEERASPFLLLTLWHCSVCHMPPLKPLFVYTVLDFLIPNADALKPLVVFLDTPLSQLSGQAPSWFCSYFCGPFCLSFHCQFLYLLFKRGYASSFSLPSISVVSFCSFFCSFHMPPCFNVHLRTNNSHIFISIPQFSIRFKFHTSIWLVEISISICQQGLHVSIYKHKHNIFPF